MKKLVATLIAGSFTFTALATFVGNAGPGNGFDSTSAVSVRSMNEKGGGNARPMINTINGAGMYLFGGNRVHTDLTNDPTDPRSSFNGVTMGFQDGTPTGEPSPRGGTVVGSQWAEFGFDQAYDISNVHIWNYNESGQAFWAMQGMRDVTIEVTSVGDGFGWGSTDPNDWTTLFAGSLNMGGALNLTAQILPANMTFQYLVITSSTDDLRVNFMDDFLTSPFHSIEAGLSEIQFEIVPEPSALALLGLGAVALILRRRR